VTPRGTDWTLAILTGLCFGTGLVSLVSGRSESAWVIAAHGIGGVALGVVAGIKLRRVWRRLMRPALWDRRTPLGLGATLLVVAVIASGVAWSSGGNLIVAGWNLLNWHIALGFVLTAATALHMIARARRPLTRDLVSRRLFMRQGAIAAGAVGAWLLQRPAAAAAGWRGAERRWTGSYESGSWRGNAFPEVSWVADRPRPLDSSRYRLHVGGLVATPLDLTLAAIDTGDTIDVTLDCTGGFFTTQRWRGIAVSRLLAMAEPLPGATHVRVVSRTGYRWSFPLDESRGFLLATHVGDEPLSHGHGAPVRLVAPGRRGFQWIKWVTHVELHQGIDTGAAASTVWSSFTPEGRGEA
jgi:multisubunit Na+/H+ antiporter MnhG subunit